MKLKLYAFGGACSLHPHISLIELGLPHEVRVLGMEGDEAGWAELEKLNSMKRVPVLVTEDGSVITEGVAIQMYLVSRKPNELFPAEGMDRYRAFEWLNFISSTLHVGFGPLFDPEGYCDDPGHAASIRRQGVARLEKLIQVTESRFPDDSDHPIGGRFTVVDAYLFNILSWTKFAQIKVPLDAYPKLAAFLERTKKRPSVIEAIRAGRAAKS